MFEGKYLTFCGCFRHSRHPPCWADTRWDWDDMNSIIKAEHMRAGVRSYMGFLLQTVSYWLGWPGWCHADGSGRGCWLTPSDWNLTAPEGEEQEVLRYLLLVKDALYKICQLGQQMATILMFVPPVDAGAGAEAGAGAGVAGIGVCTGIGAAAGAAWLWLDLLQRDWDSLRLGVGLGLGLGLEMLSLTVRKTCEMSDQCWQCNQCLMKLIKAYRVY